MKSELGRTATGRTPLNIRGDVPIDYVLEAKIRARMARSLDPFGTRVRRVSIRFEDINGARGGVDTLCTMKVLLDREGQSVVVRQLGETAEHAFALAVPRVTRSVRKLVGRRGGRAPAPTMKAKRTPTARRRRAAQPRTLIGRRVGQGTANLEEALDRPEKRRRDVYVDTAAPGTSASDRRAGGPNTARRNTKARRGRMTVALEDSLKKRPSRKSTRRSANRQKGGTTIARSVKARKATPKRKATRSGA
ncbi:MAG: hypothetical protein HOV80_25300 [Polyangiaceae bacterium]|nr:hypothetical protein [Polyangiaceae bacterium]